MVVRQTQKCCQILLRRCVWHSTNCTQPTSSPASLNRIQVPIMCSLATLKPVDTALPSIIQQNIIVKCSVCVWIRCCIYFSNECWCWVNRHCPPASFCDLQPPNSLSLVSQATCLISCHVLSYSLSYLSWSELIMPLLCSIKVDGNRLWVSSYEDILLSSYEDFFR